VRTKRRPGLACASKDGDLLRDPGANPVTLCLEVVADLKIEPEALAGAEVPGETKSRVGRDAALPQNDLVDASGGHVNIPREAVLRETERLKKLGLQDLAGMNGRVLRHLESCQW
jgi:hypothetical protein